MKLEHPDQRAAYERGERPGHSFAEPVRAVHAVSAGMQLGLWEMLGLDMHPLDLNAAMDLLLSEAAQQRPIQVSEAPEASLQQAEHSPSSSPPGSVSRLVRSWLRGEPAFAKAHGGDASDDQAQIALAGAVGLSPPPRG